MDIVTDAWAEWTKQLAYYSTYDPLINMHKAYSQLSTKTTNNYSDITNFKSHKIYILY